MTAHCFDVSMVPPLSWVSWQVRYDRCWHSWHKLNSSAEQIMSSGTLRLPPVHVVDSLKPGFTQPKKQLIYLFHGRGHLYLLFTHPIKDEWRVLSLWTKPCQSLEQRKWGNGHINRTSLNCCISLKFPGIWANELIWNGGTRTGRGVKSQRARLHVFPHISPSLTLMAELQRDWTVPVNPSVLQSGH